MAIPRRSHSPIKSYACWLAIAYLVLLSLVRACRNLTNDRTALCWVWRAPPAADGSSPMVWGAARSDGSGGQQPWPSENGSARTLFGVASDSDELDAHSAHTEHDHCRNDPADSSVDGQLLYVRCYDFFHLAVLKQRTIDVEQPCTNYGFGARGAADRNRFDDERQGSGFAFVWLQLQYRR